MIVVDTSVLSRAFRRKRPGPAEQRARGTLEELMIGDTELGIPGVVLQEILSGIRTDTEFADLRAHLVAAFTILHPTTGNHIEAARLRNTCLKKGLNASGTDCLIATLTIAGGHELFVMDSDFSAIAKHSPLKLFRNDIGA